MVCFKLPGSHGLAGAAISVASFVITSQGKMADAMSFSVEWAERLLQVHSILTFLSWHKLPGVRQVIANPCWIHTQPRVINEYVWIYGKLCFQACTQAVGLSIFLFILCLCQKGLRVLCLFCEACQMLMRRRNGATERIEQQNYSLWTYSGTLLNLNNVFTAVIVTDKINLVNHYTRRPTNFAGFYR